MRGLLDRTAGSYYSTGAYRANEALYVVASGPTSGAIPVIWCHGALDTAAHARTADRFDDLDDISNLSMPVLAGDFGTSGGVNKWANDDSRDAVEDVITWAASNLGTRTDKVVFAGESMGSLLAMNMALENLDRVAALAARGPVFAFEAFYDRVVEFQDEIDAAYTNHTGFLNALPNRDPARQANLAKLRQIAHKIGVWYTEDDEYLPVSEVELYAKHIGVAKLDKYPGTHTGIKDISSVEFAEFIQRAISAKATVV